MPSENISMTKNRLITVFCATGERNRGYVLLMVANKPETALYRAPTFSVLVSHGGISSGRFIFVIIIIFIIFKNLFIYFWNLFILYINIRAGTINRLIDYRNRLCCKCR